MEDRYQDKWDSHMMADYCWSFLPDSPGKDARKMYKRKFAINK